MYKANFGIENIGNSCHSINDGDKTVAVLSSQGIIDWLLRYTDIEGEKITELKKEPHLSYINGIKIELPNITPATQLVSVDFVIAEDGSAVTINAQSESPDKNFISLTTATLYVKENGVNYEWHLKSVLAYNGNEKYELKDIEYNNVYPHGVGRCMLFEREKLYSHTLLQDADGVFWDFPHQHAMHYGGKINEVKAQGGKIGGFFGEPCPDGCTIVQVVDGNAITNWGICDMYYDLHCLAVVPNGTFNKGEKIEMEYIVTNLFPDDANALLRTAKKLPVSDENIEYYDYPSIHLGFNSCAERVNIAGMDDSSYFRPNPPVKVWDKSVGISQKGSLRITNDSAQETIWGIEPPTQIPEESTLNITAYIKTEDVKGKGAYIRMNYFTFVWHPTPHCEWEEPLVTEPINGTSDWVKVTLPELKVPKEHFDYLINLELILDGEGVAWFTDFDLDLKYKVKSHNKELKKSA